VYVVAAAAVVVVDGGIGNRVFFFFFKPATMLLHNLNSSLCYLFKQTTIKNFFNKEEENDYESNKYKWFTSYFKYAL
jgi:hypothetical protein